MGRKRISSEAFNSKYIGQQFGNIIILEYVGYNDHRHMVITKCLNCNTISTKRFDQLKERNPKYCMNCRKESNKPPSINSSFNRHYSAFRGNAQIRNMEWNINQELFKKITQQDCYYCGNHPRKSGYSKVGHKGLKSTSYSANGIDRVDNSLGYIETNIVSCCSTCNRMKNKFSIDLFYEQISKIYTLHLKERSTTSLNDVASSDAKKGTSQKDDDIVSTA